MKYPGRLGKPIVRKPRSLLNYEESARAAIAAEIDEMFDKLPDLFKLYGIQESNWCSLAIALAKEHVPGFKLVEPAGRKTEWGGVEKAEFRLDVDAVRSASKKALDASIREAIKSERWREKTMDMKISALRQHYYQADERMIKLVQSSRNYDRWKETGEIR